MELAVIFDTATNIFLIITILFIIYLLKSRTKHINKIDNIEADVIKLEKQYNTIEERFIKYLGFLDRELKKRKK